MSSFRSLCVLLFGVALILVGWQFEEVRRSSATRTPTSAGAYLVDEQLLEIAAEYKEWGRVDDQMRWAPGLCMTPLPARVYFSDSADNHSHGQKLYSLFVRHHDQYADLGTRRKAVSVGQAIVKQSWLPEEVTDAEHPPDPFTYALRTPWQQTRAKPHRTC